MTTKVFILFGHFTFDEDYIIQVFDEEKAARDKQHDLENDEDEKCSAYYVEEWEVTHGR